ncbi:MAG: GNAT family N-acetyltransferase [Acidobacteriota bacterium]|nr:GNAT family N-acetyltransferase [Acidobacteriota bacterium]
MVVVRRARLSDIDEIAFCLSASFAPYRQSYTAAAYEDTVPAGSGVGARLATMTVFVAEGREGAIIGTVGASASGEEGHIRGMAVLPRAQGTGAAASLLEAVEGELRDRGCSSVTLDTTSPLVRAIRFYERCGYRATGKIADFFGMPLHEYRKDLNGRKR